MLGFADSEVEWWMRYGWINGSQYDLAPSKNHYNEAELTYPNDRGAGAVLVDAAL